MVGGSLRTPRPSARFDSDAFEGGCARLEGALENRFGNAPSSLAVYPMPGETFDAVTADRQEP